MEHVFDQGKRAPNNGCHGNKTMFFHYDFSWFMIVNNVFPTWIVLPREKKIKS